MSENTPLAAREIVLGVVVIVIGALAVTSNAWHFLDGVGVFSRVILGAVGIGGAMRLLMRKPMWSRVLIVWSALQIPVIIVDPTGDMTNQVLHLGMQWTRQTAINDVIVEMSGWGFNLVGTILLVWVLYVRRAQRPPADPAAVFA